MLTEEIAGTSRSYYSTTGSSSSTASSLRSGSITTTTSSENRDLSVFTFIVSKCISPDVSHLPDQIVSSAMSPFSNNSNGTNNCHCFCTNSDRFNENPTNNISPIDPFGVNPRSHLRLVKHHNHHTHSHNTGNANCKLCHPNSMYDDDEQYSSIIGENSIMDGFLLRSLEKGVLYPVIHWSSKSNENLALSSQTRLSRSNSVVFNQGVYRELKRVIPPDAWMHKVDVEQTQKIRKRSTWMVIGYKSLEKTLDSSLEATWKEWTGSRHIYLNLRHDFDIQRISFFNRIHPVDNLDLFMYLVLMEIGNVDESNVMWLLDFVQRTRVERMKGFLTVYSQVENEISTLSDEYLKYFSPKANITEVANHDISGKKFIEKLIQEIHDTPLVDYF